MKNFELKITTEGSDSSKVLWLTFKSSNKNSGMINLNNIANERGHIVGKALKDAISDYIFNTIPETEVPQGQKENMMFRDNNICVVLAAMWIYLQTEVPHAQ
jgi:hypothetical protein